MHNKIEILVYIFAFHKGMISRKGIVSKKSPKVGFFEEFVKNLQVEVTYYAEMKKLDSKLKKLLKNENFSIL